MKEIIPIRSKKKEKRTDFNLMSVGVLLGVVLLIIGVATAIKSVADWGAGHQFVKQQVVALHVQAPYRIEKIEPKIVQEIVATPDIDRLEGIEKYICEKFGLLNCSVALAVAKSESGMREDAYNVNTNGTFDYGIWQINSVNHKIEGCEMKSIVDAYKNTDCAYIIWDRADGEAGNGKGSFKAWTVFMNGSFIGNID